MEAAENRAAGDNTEEEESEYTSRSYVEGVEHEGDKDKDIEEVKEDPGARM